MRGALKWTAVFVFAVLLLLALFVLFGLNTLRQPLSRTVTQATGRELLIEGDLEPVWDAVHLAFRVEGVRFGNPEWAHSDYLLTAQAVEARIELLPLLSGRIVLPALHLERPTLNLVRDAQGRTTWDLGDKIPSFDVRRLTVDQGELQYRDAVRGLVAEGKFSSDATGIAFSITGECRGERFTEQGRSAAELSGILAIPQRLPCRPPAV